MRKDQKFRSVVLGNDPIVRESVMKVAEEFKVGVKEVDIFCFRVGVERLFDCSDWDAGNWFVLKEGAGV